MSAAHTDPELLEQIRLRAFEGMVITVMLSADEPLKPTLQAAFGGVLKAIDEGTPL